MNTLELKVKKLCPSAKLPTYNHENPGDAGMDIYPLKKDLIQPGERVTIRTGIATEFSPEFVALIWDKSGLAKKRGLTTLAGVIDSNYRKEWKVVLWNTGDADYEVKLTEPVAQVVFQPVMRAQISVVEKLSDSERAGGFHSGG